MKMGTPTSDTAADPLNSWDQSRIPPIQATGMSFTLFVVRSLLSSDHPVSIQPFYLQKISLDSLSSPNTFFFLKGPPAVICQIPGDMSFPSHEAQKLSFIPGTREQRTQELCISWMRTSSCNSLKTWSKKEKTVTEFFIINSTLCLPQGSWQSENSREKKT